MSDSLVKPLLAGDRRALARAITLIESTRADHRERADVLLAELLPHTGKSVRLGITGGDRFVIRNGLIVKMDVWNDSAERLLVRHDIDA